MDFSNILKDFFRDFLLYFVNGAFLIIVFFIIFFDNLSPKLNFDLLDKFETLIIFSFTILSYVLGHVLMSFVIIEECIYSKLCRKSNKSIASKDNFIKESTLFNRNKDAYLFFVDRYNNLFYFRKLLFYNFIICAFFAFIKTLSLVSDFNIKLLPLSIFMFLYLVYIFLFLARLMFILQKSNEDNFKERVDKLNF